MKRFMVTVEERREVLREADDFAQVLSQSKISPTFMKLIVNNLNPNVPNLDKIVDLLKNESSISTFLPKLIDSLIQSEEEHLSDGLVYSTSDLAKYFQVSQTTINKWINQGRFVGVSRESNKHAKINENTEWKAANGARIKIKEIVEEYQNNHANPPELSMEDERDEILIELNALKKKYGGNLDEILGEKGELTFEEEKDLGTWSHFSKMLNDYE
ncbi:helix-turn-helix domain-containing protein [Neobacillus sp. YIM B06451]|uniref:helix-turn-helix domain-containing protein n=1 Tax=Neobacillus sp. YIM B06451 TaxID=3070994 RepID=UPI00292F2B75|nr:helix-turn-helix domain-containing protein [Neobacillus sp. YIM B06451]